jgi:hypothetical protein
MKIHVAVPELTHAYAPIDGRTDGRTERTLYALPRIAKMLKNIDKSPLTLYRTVVTILLCITSCTIKYHAFFPRIIFMFCMILTKNSDNWTLFGKEVYPHLLWTLFVSLSPPSMGIPCEFIAIFYGHCLWVYRHLLWILFVSLFPSPMDIVCEWILSHALWTCLKCLTQKCMFRRTASHCKWLVY